MDFEAAAKLRDRLRAMSHIQATQGVNPATFEEADLFAAYSEGGHTCIQVFFFRAGQNWGNRPYFPRHAGDLPLAEVLESFVGQFYDERTAPKLILTSEDLPGRALLAEALGLRAEHKVEISTPQRGEKREIMERALANAREQLGRRLAENSAQTQLLEGVADVFGLEQPPRRIEVYDNSHIQGAHALGAFIVAGPKASRKAQYRKFNIKTEELDARRRLRHDARSADPPLRPHDEGGSGASADNGKWKRPDLVLIDGGPGQLSIACQVFADLGVEDVALVGISKGPDRDAGREHFYLPGKEPFRLDPKSPVLYYLQRLRDEAHRFVIGGHRKKRSAAIGANPLDEIAGVGAGRKRALLQHFGSARAVAGASLADLSVGGWGQRDTGQENLRFLPSGRMTLGWRSSKLCRMFALPNALTILRILLVPVFVVAFVIPGEVARLVAFVVFALAGISDWLDGFAARKLKAGSDFGRMLDPIADKVLVAVALMMLVAEGTFRRVNPAPVIPPSACLRLVPALIILSREILVSGMREFLAGTRVSVPVTAVAKFKTAVQMIAIGAMILTPLADDAGAGHPVADLYRHRLYAVVGGGRADRLYRRDLFQERRGAFAPGAIVGSHSAARNGLRIVRRA